MNATSLAQKFVSLTSDLATRLRELGFSRHKAFILKHSAGVVIVELQKSLTTSNERLIFAVNIGLVCRVLLSEADCPGRSLRIEDTHWRRRLPASRATDGEWWVLTAASDLVQLSQEITTAIRNVLPEALALTEPAVLRDLWLGGYSPGLTEPERLMALVRLLSRIGPAEMLEATCKLLQDHAEGRPYWPAARAILKSAGINNK